jgi:hypothetical protein
MRNRGSGFAAMAPALDPCAVLTLFSDVQATEAAHQVLSPGQSNLYATDQVLTLQKQTG